MPTYTYECTKHKPALLTYITRKVDEAEQPVTCSQCGELKQRIYVAPPTWFKGSGWFSNDS